MNATDLAVERVASVLASIDARLIRTLPAGHYLCCECGRIGPVAELVAVGADLYRHPHAERQDCPADLAVAVILARSALEEVAVQTA